MELRQIDAGELNVGAVERRIGHNVPQEAPQAFAQAILDLEALP